MDGWLDGWLDGWMDGWMDGWLDGWVLSTSNKEETLLQNVPNKANVKCLIITVQS